MAARVLALLLALIACAAVGATEDDGEDADGEPGARLEEQVVTATRAATANLDTSLPADRVDAEQIESLHPATIGDAIGHLPGVSLNAPAGAYFLNPSIRGLGGRRVALIVDGRRVDAGKPIGVTGSFVDVGDVDRIEVVRGPGSVLYGSDAIGGVIHVLTADPLGQDAFDFVNRTWVGSNNREIGDFIAGGGVWGPAGVRLNASWRKADDYETGGGERIENSYYEDANYGAKLAFVPADGHVLRIAGDAYRGGPIGRAANELDDETRRRIRFPYDDHYSAQLTYSYAPSGKTLADVFATAYYDQALRRLESSFYSDDWSRRARRLDKYDDFETAGGTAYVAVRPWTNNRLTVGIDALYRHLSQRQEVRVFLPGGREIGPTVSHPYNGAEVFAGAGFVQDEQTLGRRWNLVGGVRFDSIEQRFPEPEESGEQTAADRAVSGNLGAVFHPIDSMSLTANVGRAFRAPTPEETFVTSVFCKGVVCGNPDLAPETSLNLDLGLKGFWSFLTYEAYGFLIYVDDYITLEPGAADCDYVYGNVGLARLVGGEARLVADWRNLYRSLGVRVWATASYVHGQDVEAGEPLPQIPPLGLTGGVRLGGRPDRGLASYYAQLSVRADATQDRVSPAANLSSAPEEETGGYALFDAGLGIRTRPIAPGFSVDALLSARNLLDTTYRNHLAAVDGMGRNVKLSIAVRF